MEESFIYLIQYVKGEDTVNRFYVSPKAYNNIPIRGIIQDYIQDYTKGGITLGINDLAGIVEQDVLSELEFRRLRGIKLILKDYKKIISREHTYKFEVK